MYVSGKIVKIQERNIEAGTRPLKIPCFSLQKNQYTPEK